MDCACGGSQRKEAFFIYFFSLSFSFLFKSRVRAHASSKQNARLSHPVRSVSLPGRGMRVPAGSSFFFFFFLLPLCNWVVVSGWCWLGGSAPSTCAAPRQLGSCQCQCRTGSALGRTGHACWDLTLTPGSQTLACRPGGGSSSHHGSRVPVTTFSVLTSGTLVPAAGPTLAAASPRSRCHSM